jgi:hypothetical protein
MWKKVSKKWNQAMYNSSYISKLNYFMFLTFFYLLNTIFKMIPEMCRYHNISIRNLAYNSPPNHQEKTHDTDNCYRK